MVFCFTRAQVCHAAPVVFPVDFDGDEHVYRVYPINVQLVSDPVIMSAKEEHGCNSGSESLEKHELRDILKDVITVSLLQKGQNDRIKNIVCVFYGIQCSLTLLSPKTVGLIHTLVRKTFPTAAVHTITSIAKAKWKS